MIRKIVEKSGLPRAEFARVGGISRATLEAWLAGTRNPSKESLQKLTDGFRRRGEEMQQIAAEMEQVTR